MSIQKVSMIAHVNCPSCNSTSRVDHLRGRGCYVWGCDRCGSEYRFSFVSDSLVDVELTGKVSKSCVDLVEIKPQKESLFLTVETREYSEDADLSYYYNEHTCPSNVLRACEEVYLGGAEDVHGVITFVGRVYKDIEDTRLEDFGIQFKK